MPKITKMTNAVVVWGRIHVFHYSRKVLSCDKCSLKPFCDHRNEFWNMCLAFLKLWPAGPYKDGVFRLAKEIKEENNAEH